MGYFKAVWPKESGFSVPGDAKSLILIDWNDDARLDLLVGRNNDTMLAFRNETDQGATPMMVNLRGSRKNPYAIGAKVTAVMSDRSSLMRECYAGNSYLSQSSPSIHFSIPSGTFESASRHEFPSSLLHDNGRRFPCNLA
jgi:hypothetical protein